MSYGKDGGEEPEELTALGRTTAELFPVEQPKIVQFSGFRSGLQYGEGFSTSWKLNRNPLHFEAQHAQYHAARQTVR